MESKYYVLEIRNKTSDPWLRVQRKDSLEGFSSKPESVSCLREAMKYFHKRYGRIKRNGTRIIYEMEFINEN